MRFPFSLTNDQIQTIINYYESDSLPLTNNYTLFRTKINTTTLTIFKTKTIMLQGGNENEVCLKLLEFLKIDPKTVNISQNNSETTSDNKLFRNLIGTDEVGTGDFFGGIVVVACYVKAELINDIKKLGVRDSKELSDSKIMDIAPKIMEMVTYTYLKLDDIHYNYLISKYNYNMNSIKANMHNSVINSIKKKVTDYDEIIIDAFTSSNNYFNYLKNVENVSKDVTLEEKAENKYLAVACASIIARYMFVQDLEQISNEIGFDLPKGAGKPVDAVILKMIKNDQQNLFKKISKNNFNNLRKYIK